MARGSFKSKFGVIAAVGGSVVGLGNIWRFPYIAGENGGGAFLLVYICVSLLVAVPILLGELILGRQTKTNSFGAFRAMTAPKKTLWPAVGLLGIISAFLIASFYMVISGWGVEFLALSIIDRFNGQSAAEIQQNLSAFIASGWKPMIYMAVFVAANYVISLLGVEKGIEKFTKFLMPLMIVLIGIIMLNSLSLPNAMEGVKFLFVPDFSKITPQVVLMAVGQAFFSLTLGIGAMIIYGSYVKEDVNLYHTAAAVAICDVVVAILSGLAIFPAVFSFGINPTSGPDLVFITLPNLFQQMAGGYFLSVLFFFIIVVAAITSSLSLVEVVTSFINEELKLSRKKAATIAVVAITASAALCAYSMIPDSAVKVAGMSLFDLFDSITTKYTMPLGGLLTCIFVGWVIEKRILRKQLTNNGGLGRSALRIYMTASFIIRYLAPIVIVLIFLDVLNII